MKDTRKKLLAAAFLPFLLSNSPAPGWPQEDVPHRIQQTGSGISLTNESEDLLINAIGLGDVAFEEYNSEYFARNNFTGYLIKPGETAILDLTQEEKDKFDEMGESSLFVSGLDISKVVFTDTPLKAETNGEDITVSFDLDNTGSYVTKDVGFTYPTENGWRYVTTSKEVGPGEKKSITITASVPKDYIEGQDVYSFWTYDNSYYTEHYSGDPLTPLAIACYVIGGFLVLSLVIALVVLLVKKSHSKRL